ncbi:hypothetical protein OHS18_22015 [Amycolatopsis sp. NBC_00355]|uniref:hypothetical protein n=1 Tax=Amycolatopsis sp. NBC_00355 TaxID=2975957 RepID=UPI002E263841
MFTSAVACPSSFASTEAYAAVDAGMIDKPSPAPRTSSNAWVGHIGVSGPSQGHRHRARRHHQ